ncbi:MAG: MBL fold metallo-hydrolase [Bacillota bacterium]|jgi:hydroxyacylglutathione hydrolase
MSNYHLERMDVGQLGTNCYLLLCEKSKKVAIIDPGADGGKIAAKIAEEKWQPQMIINTHGHWDHIGANKYLQDLYDIPILIHEDDAVYLKDGSLSLADWLGNQSDGGTVSRLLSDGDLIKLGELSMQVIHAPGHSPGGICLYLAPEQILICGDTLFEYSVGRTDLPGGDFQTLTESIRLKLFILPDEVAVYPGHGPATSIGKEKKFNAFVKE